MARQQRVQFYPATMSQETTRQVIVIYTLTLNTAIDMNISCDAIQPGVVNRSHSTEYCPNGKGVNVALVLHHFKKPVHILGIFGGFTGQYIVEELTARQLSVTPVWVNNPTRINVFINDGHQEYKLVNPGNTADQHCCQQILQRLEVLSGGDSLVISGSLPPGIDSDFYRQILELCHAKGCEVILDISHPSLKQLISQRPLLIKPNDEELAEIFGLPADDEAQIRHAMSVLHTAGARNVLLTLGQRGMYFSDGETLWSCTAPTVELVSSACAGDAALGAFLSLWAEGGEVTEALRLASATGADVAGSAGLGELSRINQLIGQIQTRRL